MNTKIYYLFIFLLGFTNISLLGQEKNDDDHDHADFHCGDTIHGIPTLPILIEECEQNTVITSLPKDGTKGTVVYGAIESSQIQIVPGHTFVRIVSYPDDDLATSHTTTRFRRRKKEGSGKQSSATITEAILPVKKSDKPIENIKIFPNPFRDVLQMTSEVYPIIAYEIQDLYGKTIRKKTVKATYKQVVSVSELQKGIYLLSLYFQNGTQQQQTIIKQ